MSFVEEMNSTFSDAAPNLDLLDGIFSALKQDLSNAPSSGNAGRLLPTELEYEAVVVECEGKLSKNEKKMLSITLDVRFPAEFKGVKIYDNLMLDNLGRLKMFLEATNFLGEDERFSGEGPADFIGRGVRFKVKHDEFPVGTGKVKNKVDYRFYKPEVLAENNVTF